MNYKRIRFITGFGSLALTLTGFISAVFNSPPAWYFVATTCICFLGFVIATHIYETDLAEIRKKRKEDKKNTYAAELSFLSDSELKKRGYQELPLEEYKQVAREVFKRWEKNIQIVEGE